MAFAIVLAVLLGHWFGAGGVAAAIALGAWSTALTLIRSGAETFGFSIDAAARRRLPGILAAALAMGAAFVAGDTVRYLRSSQAPMAWCRPLSCSS